MSRNPKIKDLALDSFLTLKEPSRGPYPHLSRSRWTGFYEDSHLESLDIKIVRRDLLRLSVIPDPLY